MLRRRIIFTLIYSNNNFCQSRNFRLQEVGDIGWLENNYNFFESSKFLDELILLNASRDEENFSEFLNIVKRLARNIFIPISVGGKIYNEDQIKCLFDNGSDKIVFNSNLFLNRNFVEKISSKYGESSIIGSIDIKKNNFNSLDVYINNGQKLVKNSIQKLIEIDNSNLVGEFFINSIDNDGTGFGFDLELFKMLNLKLKKPIIFSGGAGSPNHFLEAFKNKSINSLATANLFNFIGDGLFEVRKTLIENKVNIANRN